MKNSIDPNIDYSRTNDCSHASPFIALRNDCTIKVSKKLAKEILMNDITVNRLGTVRYLQLKHIGLGIYEVKLLPSESHDCNSVVTSFY